MNSHSCTITEKLISTRKMQLITVHIGLSIEFEIFWHLTMRPEGEATIGMPLQGNR